MNLTRRTILLARHGETDLNAADKIRGWRDVSLNENGEKQAQALGNKLKKEKFDFIISSDLKRATQTAESIAEKTGKPILLTTRGLRPWDLGDYTGLESGVAIEKIKPYVENKPNKTIPGGESFDSFKKRFLGEVKTILEKYPDKTPLLVAHHRNDRLLDAWSQGKGGDSINFPVFESRGISPADFARYHIYLS